MTDTLNYWRTEYSWRDAEALLNKMPQLTTTISLEPFGDIKIHFVHSPASQPSTPLLFLHGWPGSFIEVQKVLPGLNAAGYTVIAPSLPGFGFTTCPSNSGFTLVHHAQLLKALMQKLNYPRFAIQGGDWGAMIAWTIGVYHPESITAIHINLLSIPHPDFSQEPTYTDFEKRSLAQHDHFNTHEFAYYMIQNTKPRTLGFALHDSPIGMLAWMADKLLTWSDSHSYTWTSRELITWTLLHYFPGPTTAFQIYRENGITEMTGGPRADEYLKVPLGVSAFAKEAEMVPRSWAEKRANVVFWREHERGGHFAAWERPGEFVEDLVSFKEVCGV